MLFYGELSFFNVLHLKALLDERQKGVQEQIQAWKDSLPPTEAELVENTAFYLARHPQPTATFEKLKKITASCHRQYADRFKYFCASKNAQHEVPYYDSGDFNEECSECAKALLRSEKEGQDEHRWGKCCSYGDVHTEIMKAEYNELTSDAPEELRKLALYRDKSERENFLENTLALNNAHAFGSVTCGKVIYNSQTILLKLNCF